ncbi:MAG TPA: sigma-70 family RNA polymerase sigma factor [Actinophytocola sp.]|uniref:sigma-70 family RNA polymerase sigma factor n=1 Tax=Actinophytocola sp. TaxID=1872138 RepID=UPI002DDDA61D|nr:sigma-70 family RNA polymerase sigma factor [Actinophytocola sp.]HEV2780562.1 sigma-70 family RNA polymerase sigma factor [Actinophytocola sp.]
MLETSFQELVERHRRELRVHCYRMLGSFSESEDLVQETFLRAWRARGDFEGRSSLRTWLYRIATNACLDVLARRPRRVLPQDLGPASAPDVYLPPRTDIPWLQPFPDSLLAGDEPDAEVVARETIELAFLAAVQHLPPRQRAVLILRDVLGWRAAEVAALLETSVASANSALQRARGTLREHLPQRRSDWTRPAAPTPEELELRDRFMAAFERSDVAAIAELLHADARAVMPPYPMWHEGRDTITTALSGSLDKSSASYIGELRLLPTAANRQPAAAFYVRAPGDTEFRAFAVDLLRIEDGRIVEIAAFHAELFGAFGLPLVL